MGCVKGCAGGGGGAHHRLLTSPPDAEALTRRILEPGRQARFVASPQVVGFAGAQHGAALGRCLQLCMGAAWGGAWAQHGAAHERGMGLRMSVAWGCAWGVPRGVHGGGGAPHHRLLASPPDAEALTRRILVPGLQARFVASPQVVGLAL